MRGVVHFSGLEAIRMGMEIEHREHRFFVSLAQRARSEVLRDIFSGMAQDTMTLWRALRARLADFSDGGFWDEEEEIVPYLHRLPDDLFEAAGEFRARMDKLKTDREALDLAIEVEEYLANYFHGVSERSTHPDGRSAFAWLAGEKDRHVRALCVQRTGSSMDRAPG
jgi:rubrerythrin